MMLNNRIRRHAPLIIIYFLITCVFVSALFIALWFSRGTYLSLVGFVTTTLNRPDLRPLITHSLFPREKYDGIYKWHWAIYPFITIATVYLYYYAQVIYENAQLAICYLQLSFFHLIVFFKNLSRYEKVSLALLCCLYCLVVLYNDLQKEISYDEAWGYNYYINKPFYFSLILFNTYPLFNFISHFFSFLPFDTLINIRLPSVVFGILCLLVLFYFIYREKGFFLSIVALVVLISSPLFYIYSSLSRGITLSLLLSIITLHIVVRLGHANTFNKRYRFLYVLVNFLGIVSMPTFFVYTICNSLFLIYQKKNDQKFVTRVITSGLIIAVAAFIFYSPVILASGLNLIYHNNHYTFNIVDSLHKLKGFVFGLSELFFVSKYVAILLLLAALSFVFQTHWIAFNRINFFYCVFIILSTLIVRAATGNIFPGRSLNYLILPFIILLIWIISIIFNHFSIWLKTAVSTALFVFMCLAIFYNQKLLYSPVEDKDAKIIANALLANQVETAYIDEEEFWFRVPMVQYYYGSKGRKINFITSAEGSTRFQPFNINNNYDCIVSKAISNSNLSILYKIIYRNNSFVLWKRL